VWFILKTASVVFRTAHDRSTAGRDAMAGEYLASF